MPGFGRLVATDDRDRAHLARRLLAPDAPLPASRYYIAPTPLDQKNTSTCVAHAWTHYLGCSPIRQSGPPPFELYDECIATDEFAENDVDPARQFGTSVRAGAKALQRRGYLGGYSWAFSLEDALAWVLGGKGPMVVGTSWFSGMMRADAEGIIRATGPELGGHAYLLIGASRTRGMARILNSWGPSYAQRGRAWLPFEDLSKLITEGGEACTATEIRRPS